MSINLSMLPQHISLAVRDNVILALPSYSNAGNSWSAHCITGNAIADVEIVLDRLQVEAITAPPGTQEPPTIMSVPERAVISGLNVGKAVWQLRLGRVFGSSPMLAKHDLHITVQPCA